MPRAPNPLQVKAEKLYRQGMNLAKIAAKLEIPSGTVRRWKSEGHWDNERSETNNQSVQKANAPKRRGPPKGSKNAVGNSGGAPIGNVNALKHGFYYDALLPDEQSMLQSRAPLNEEERLENAIALWEFKIRRLLRELQEVKRGTTMVPHQVTKEGQGIKSTAVNRFEHIQALEKLLTAAQNGYQRCVEALHRIRLEGGTPDEDESGYAAFVGALTSETGSWSERKEEEESNEEAK